MDKGFIIKNLRETVNMSQEELAERIGVKKQTIYKYENGIVTNIPSDKIEQISEVFGVTPDYIMGWKTAPRTSTATYLAPLEQELINDFRKLTDYGKKAAVERLKELTELSAYTIEKKDMVDAIDRIETSDTVDSKEKKA